MAATRLIALHINKGRTIGQTLSERLDYTENPEKTDGGKYITSYACDPMTADEEFLFAKRQYEYTTGRQHEHSVIAYQIRQSFRLGEISPEESNRVGYETAMRFTKGRHAFIVATHTDRAHIHNHIIFNSTSLDCTRKFRDFHLSGLALQRVSDRVCLEHGLSIITPKPKSEREKYSHTREISGRDKIRAAIDEALAKSPQDLPELIAFLREAGYAYKDGKSPSLRGPGQERFARFSSLGEGYSIEELDAAILGKCRRPRNRGNQRHEKKFSLLIDIQQKITEGKGAGYARWASVFNLKQMAQVLCFLQENGINDYSKLTAKTNAAIQEFETLGESIKSAEHRLQDISALKKHIINYVKTRDVYVAYRKAGYSKKFFEEHREEITLHKAAKDAFDQMGVKKLPRITELNAEYAKVLAQKKAAYPAYRKARAQMQEYLIAQKVAAVVLDKEQERREEELQNQQNQQQEDKNR